MSLNYEGVFQICGYDQVVHLFWVFVQ